MTAHKNVADQKIVNNQATEHVHSQLQPQHNHADVAVKPGTSDKTAGSLTKNAETAERRDTLHQPVSN